MDVAHAGTAPQETLRQAGKNMTSGKRGPVEWLGAYFGVLGQPRTYRSLLYLLLGLPLGVVYFTTLVTLISLAGGLAVTVVGLPLAILTMYAWCEIARVERLQANALAGTRIPPLAWCETGHPIGWSRIKQRLRNGLTWRSLAFLFLRFPHGIATFVIAVTAVSVPLYLIGMPAVAAWGGDD
ncbi:MAG: sensor domain-containing protein, partial [Dehalococcoidia bacterium]|nr:sensor domain-containing protein [Dehalococcoidia bacterium]